MSMSQGTLTLPKPAVAPAEQVREQTYWSAVAGKLFRDKITVAALALLIFMVSSALAGPARGRL